MKLLFLDIDGVLNNAYTKERFSGFIGIDARLRDMFLRYRASRDFDVVLSSSWRIPSAFGDFKQHLKDNGITWIGETLSLPWYDAPRGHEIQDYLIKNTSPEGTQFVILDDLGPSEFLKHQRPFLVQTSAVQGLEPKKLKAIDKLLGYSDAEDGQRGLLRPAE